MDTGNKHFVMLMRDVQSLLTFQLDTHKKTQLKMFWINSLVLNMSTKQICNFLCSHVSLEQDNCKFIHQSHVVCVNQTVNVRLQIKQGSVHLALICEKPGMPV